MTASSYQGIPLDMAGERFGLSLEDLEELFDLREGATEEKTGDQFQGLPLIQTKTTEKGRGGALSFKAPRMPTASKTYGALEGSGDTIATGGSVGNIKIGAFQPPATPAKDTRPGISVAFGASPEYFGHEDYFRNLEAGYSPTELREYVSSNKNLLRGENVPGAGGLYDQIMRGGVPTMGFSGDAYRQQQQMNKISTAAGQSAEYFGHKDLEAARSQGVSDTDIKKFLDQNISKLQGVNVPGGGGVYDIVSGKAPAPTPPRAPISTAAGQSAEFFGHEDLAAAQRAGYSNEEIKSYLQSNQNLLRGVNVPGGGGLYDELFGRR
jgi:hypothetical protein